MAAAAKNGTLTFRGSSGQIYTYSVYLSDVANAFITWATTEVASATVGTTFVTAPEDMKLVFARISAAPTDTTSLVLWVDDSPVPNSIIGDAAIADAINNKVFAIKGIKRGRKLQLKQV